MIRVTHFESVPQHFFDDDDSALQWPFEDMAKSCIFESHVPAMISPFDNVPFVAPAAGSPELTLLLTPTTDANQVSLETVHEMFNKPKSKSKVATTAGMGAPNSSAAQLADASSSGRRNLLDTTLSYSYYPCSGSASLGWSGSPTNFHLQCSAQIGVM